MLQNIIKAEIRAVIHYYFLRKKSPIQIHDRLLRAYFDCTPSLRTVQKWVKRFTDWKIGVEDEQRCGRPKRNLADEISKIIDDDPYLSCKKIATTVSASRMTVKRIITEDLNMFRLNAKWIPHELTDANKKSRVEGAANMLSAIKNLSSRQRANVVTGDETWICFENPRKSMWGY